MTSNPDEELLQKLRDLTDPYGYADDEICLPSIEDELEDMVEDIMLYPQNYSEAQMEMVGLTLDDVYSDTETPPNDNEDEDEDRPEIDWVVFSSDAERNWEFYDD